MIPACAFLTGIFVSALYDACASSRTDQLLGTFFEYKVTDYLIYTEVECVIKGFSATAAAVKLIDKKPVVLNSWQKLEYVGIHEKPQILTGDNPKTVTTRENNAISGALSSLISSTIRQILK